MRAPTLAGAFDNVMGPDLLFDSKTRASPKKPDQFDVFMLNDDYTSMDFVTGVLQKYFQKSRAEAQSLTDRVHRSGIALAGTYNFEIADTKANQVMAEARKHEFPFLLMLERRL